MEAGIFAIISLFTLFRFGRTLGRIYVGAEDWLGVLTWIFGTASFVLSTQSLIVVIWELLGSFSPFYIGDKGLLYCLSWGWMAPWKGLDIFVAQSIILGALTISCTMLLGAISYYAVRGLPVREPFVSKDSNFVVR
ncbi:MAG: hypothetical protein JWN37_410 [Candidatus Nomurabacteria bacterium]|nr:hypothetical protein [Candidatus Nomurabacteria bacterium]